MTVAHYMVRLRVRRFSSRQKEAAAANQDAAQRVAIASGFLTAGVAAIPGFGPLLALAPAMVGAAYGSRAIAQGRIYRDPPRPDFEIPVRLAAPGLDLSLLGNSLFEESLGALGLLNEEAAAAARAVVRGGERAMGAEQAGELGYAEARRNETESFARRLAYDLQDVVGLAAAARDALGDLPPLGPAVRGADVVLENVLPDETLAGLYRMGVRHSYVTEPLDAGSLAGGAIVSDLRGVWLDQLSLAAAADGRYAMEIQQQLESGAFWQDDRAGD